MTPTAKTLIVEDNDTDGPTSPEVRDVLPTSPQETVSEGGSEDIGLKTQPGVALGGRRVPERGNARSVRLPTLDRRLRPVEVGRQRPL